MTKRDARIHAMQILYSADFNGTSINTAVRCIIDEEIDPLALELVKLVEDNLSKIDSLIGRSLVNYSISRLNLVDKAIIRLATAELLAGSLDKRIIINEALEITKEFSDQGDHKAVSFNNRLLDTISKNL